jgi:hypothetical protein
MVTWIPSIYHTFTSTHGSYGYEKIATGGSYGWAQAARQFLGIILSVQPRIASGAAIRPEDLVAQMAEVRGWGYKGPKKGQFGGLGNLQNLSEFVTL